MFFKNPPRGFGAPRSPGGTPNPRGAPGPPERISNSFSKRGFGAPLEGFKPPYGVKGPKFFKKWGPLLSPRGPFPKLGLRGSPFGGHFPP